MTDDRHERPPPPPHPHPPRWNRIRDAAHGNGATGAGPEPGDAGDAGSRDTSSRDGDQPKKSAATRLVEIARDLYTLHADTDGAPYAVETAGPNIALPFRGGRRGLRAQLSAAYLAATGRVAPAAALADALTALEGEAAGAETAPCALRVATHGDGIAVDLGGPDGAAVTITPTGWQVTTESPVTWRRTALTGWLPTPVGGGKLDELRDLLPVDDASWPLLVGWLVAAVIPDVPHPVLSLHGEMGSAKSSTAAALVGLIDPSPAPLRTTPRDVDSWAIAAAGSWVVALDNVSAISGWLSDALCRAVTGDGMVRRQLYTDGDLVVLRFRRCVILTAIDAGAMRGDLADRLVRVGLERIAPEDRRTDGEVTARLDEARPRIIGALYDLVTQVLAVLPSVKLETMPRMADYARILAAIDQVTAGLDCLGRYLALGGELLADVVDDDPVASAVRDHTVRSGGSWSGTASALFDIITPDRPPKGWPPDPRSMSARLRAAGPALRSVGIEMSRGEGRDRRTIHLTTREMARNPASPSSPASRTPDDLGKRRDANGDAEPAGDANTPVGDATVTQADPPLRHEETAGHTLFPAAGDAGDAEIRAISHPHEAEPEQSEPDLDGPIVRQHFSEPDDPGATERSMQLIADTFGADVDDWIDHSF